MRMTLRTKDRTSETWTRVIAGERGEEISQGIDFTARQNFGEAQETILIDGGWTAR